MYNRTAHLCSVADVLVVYVLSKAAAAAVNCTEYDRENTLSLRTN